MFLLQERYMSEDSERTEDQGLQISEEIRASILYLISLELEVKKYGLLLKEGIKATAGKLGMKDSKFKKEIFDLVKKELDEGGVIEEGRKKLNFQDNVIDQMGLDSLKDGKEALPKVNLSESEKDIESEQG